MTAACPACVRLEKVRRGDDPFFIAELRESIWVLHEHQAYEGWCVLFLKDHHERLEELSRERQARLWEDVMDVGAAIRRAFGPRRLNIECLGNVVAHVHWHVIPRYGSPIDPDPTSTVWTRPRAELECGVEIERRKALICRVGNAARPAPQ